MRYPVLLFDLFRTIVRFTPHAPTGQVKEATWRPAMNELRGRAQPLLGPVPFDFFLDALYDASLAIAKARAPEHRETPIGERYRRALARLGLNGSEAAATAGKLARLQLEAQMANCELPTEHATLLRDLASTRRLALISNFDDGPAVQALLAHNRIDALFSAVIVSVDVNRRKPHPEVFREALRRLDAAPSAALMIGDNLPDDAGGAAGAEIDSAWVNWDGAPAPADAPRPTYTLRTLMEIRRVLEG
ncbi:MAG: HAD family hydrolase [Candidatus Binatia bacterium]